MYRSAIAAGLILAAIAMGAGKHTQSQPRMKTSEAAITEGKDQPKHGNQAPSPGNQNPALIGGKSAPTATLKADRAKVFTSGMCSSQANQAGADALLPAKPGQPSFTCVMKRGDHGPDVVALQLSLSQCYARPVETDGVLGPVTFASLVTVQQTIGVEPDGVYGPNTRDKMLFATTEHGRCERYRR